ncbi:MAG: hypothetical protein C4525_03250 [Desulfarculus sp.]|nr:MAG: hypothetical protein C4525_03250 [Desulfarculus sp.]
MFCALSPRYGRDYWLGDAAFTRRPGDYLSDGIALDGYRALVLAGELVASHAAVIISATHLIEAVTPKVRRWPIAEYVRDPRTLFWVRRPLSQTRASAEVMARFAAGLEGEPYDVSAIAGLLFSDRDDQGANPNRWADDGEWICSRLVDMALRFSDGARPAPLPEMFTRVHPTWRTPQGLNGAPIWEPEITGPPA